MGITYLDGTARGPIGKEESVSFFVDNGATYSLFPTPVWQSIGLEPTREQTFALAEGTTVQRRITGCYLILPQWETHTPVIFGELGLAFHPFSRTLHPMRMMLG